jgi:hypothetical protein
LNGCGWNRKWVDNLIYAKINDCENYQIKPKRFFLLIHTRYCSGLIKHAGEQELQHWLPCKHKLHTKKVKFYLILNSYINRKKIELMLCHIQQMVLKMETFYIMELFPLNTSFLVCNLCLHGNQCCNSCSPACFINPLQYLVWMSKKKLFGLIW